MRHTRPPWHVVDDLNIETETRGLPSVGVLSSTTIPFEERKANHRVAAAAPELLIVCQVARRLLNGLGYTGPICGQMDDAISKAVTGEACICNLNSKGVPITVHPACNRHTKKIREAAIMGREEVPWVGESHDKVIADMVAHGEPKPITGEQGFVTNTGQFVTREEAAKIAFEAGQILKPVPKLFSEDLHQGKIS